MRVSFLILILAMLTACGDKKSQNQDSRSSYDTALYLFTKTTISNNISPTGQLINKKEKTYFYSNDAINGDRIIDSVVSYVYFEYDKNNNPIRELDYNSPKEKESKPTSEIVRVYRDSLLVSEKEYWNGEIMRYRLDSFDNHNRIVKTVMFHRMPPKDLKLNDVTSVDRYDYDTTINENEFNQLGQIVRVNQYSNSNKPTSTIEYSYFNGILKNQLTKNTNGDTLGFSIFRKDGDLDLRVNYVHELNCVDSSWSQDDRIVKMVSYQKDKKQLTKTVNRYDHYGYEMESITEKNYRSQQ